jgi:hypothetical protein
VVLQDTGFSTILPTGLGLLSFSTVDEAVAAVTDVHANYGRHAAAAQEIAREYFDSSHVLKAMLDAIYAKQEFRA